MFKAPLKSLVIFVVFLGVATLFALSAGCSPGTPAKPSWTLEFTRTGGFPDYKDKIVIHSSARGEYYYDDDLVGEFAVDVGTMSQAEWIVNRDDVHKSVGAYRGINKGTQDDIRHTLKITLKDKSYFIEWDRQSKHPNALNEILPALEVMIDTAIRQLDSDA